MAVVKDNVASTSGANVTGLTLTSFTIASNSNRCLILLGGSADASGGQAFSGWSWNGSTTGIVESYDAAGGSFHRLGVAYLLAPTATTASAVVNFDGGGNPADEGFLAALSYYNVDQTTPLGTISASSAAASPAWAGCSGITDGISIGFLWANANTATVVDSLPEYVAVGTASQSNAATSISPTSAPANLVLGGLEFCSVATENNETISVSGTGWSQVGSTVAQDSTWQQALFVRVYDGSNVNPSFSWTSSVGCSARRWSIHDALTTGFGFHATNSGSTSTHSITGQNSTANNSVVMYLSHAEANTALGADADYVEKFDAGSATGPYRLVVGTRDQVTSGAGAADFSATGANASWVMRLLELLSMNVTQTQETEIENIAGFDTGNVCSETGATYNHFGWTMTGAGNGGALAFSINPSAGGGGGSDTWPPSLVVAPYVAAGRC